WQKPKLIMLHRSQQAENVLRICKTSIAGSIAGPNMDVRQCRVTIGGCWWRCQSEANKWS
ncbi:MAG: hypothetical protein AB1664_23465, partial [Thermodesulfobacteriota bacterium]